MDFKVIRIKSKVKILEKTFGGIWKYDGVCSWWCNEGRRHVSRCCSIHDEEAPSQYFFYNTDEPTKIIWWHKAGLV